MAIYSIYKWTNLINGKVYIGKTIQDPAVRRHRHITSARNGATTALHASIRKHGAEHFTFEVIFVCFDEAYLDLFETYFILYYDACMLFSGHKGYNMTLGGDGMDSLSAKKSAERQLAKGKHSSQLKLECPHCDYVGNGPYVRRFHLEFCRANPNRDDSRDEFERDVQQRRLQHPRFRWRITDPTGHTFEINNLAQFCRERTLCKYGLQRVASGDQKSYKGFTCSRVPFTS